MNIPPEFRKQLEAFPHTPRALLEAELAAGNEIAEVGHGFPAPPVGAYITLARPVTTRARAVGGGLSFRVFASPLYSGEFTDDQRVYFILEPPGPAREAAFRELCGKIGVEASLYLPGEKNSGRSENA
jgi:hypothetical protein